MSPSTPCRDSNCLHCIQGANQCQKCKPGYSLDSARQCSASNNLRSNSVGETRLLAATNCAKADEFECVSSVCPSYNYISASGACTNNANSNCTAPGSILNNGVCTFCSGLSALKCSAVCPDYRFIGGSCQSCQSLFGVACLRCSDTACLMCGYSNDLVLSSTGKACVANTCANPNCLRCYLGGVRCSQCVAGFEVTNDFLCEASTCGIKRCIKCFNTTCGNCYPGYSLSSNSLVCNAICADPYCVDCIAPGICGECATAFTPNSLGICTIDCTLIGVSNCQECSNFFSCTKCSTGFNLASSGSACVATPSVANCLIGISGDTTTCFSCFFGFDLSANGKNCTASTCQVEYCQTCSSKQCLACITGFTLSTDKLSCASACPAASPTAFPNCLLCSTSDC